MLPRRVGGADESLSPRPLPSRFAAEFHDQLPNVSAPLPPFAACGGGGGVVGRDCEWACEAACSEYVDRDSRIRCSSGATRLGEGGQGADGGLLGAKGEGPGCQPCARMSAAVCRRPRLPGCGSTTLERGWGPGGGGGAAFRKGDDCVVLPPPMDPYGRRAPMDKLEGTVGR